MRPPILVLLPSLKQADWPAWRFLLSDTAPECFEAWERTVRDAEDDAIRRGQSPRRVEIDPMKFAAWCVQTDTDPGKPALDRFATHTGTLLRFM